MINCKTKLDYRIAEVDEILEYINPQQTLTFCKECPIYNKCWACPPFNFDPVKFWKKYEKIAIINLSIDYPEFLRKLPAEKQRELGMLIIEREKLKLLPLLYKIESSIQGSKILGAGTCTFCALEGGCAKMIGKPCRHPDYMRYSIESLGGDVVALLDNYFDTKIEFTSDGTLPKRHNIVFGILY